VSNSASFPSRAAIHASSSSSASQPLRSMPSYSRRSLLSLSLAAPATLLLPFASLAARPEGVSRPDLLPEVFTTVIDLENFLASGEVRRLRERLADLETRTGFKIRVLTQRYPVTPGLAVRDYWGLDDGKSVLLVADFFKGTGSFLHFTVGEEVDAVLAPRFFSLLASKYGNMFYVRKNGESASILTAVDAIRTCLLSKTCKVPPEEAGSIFSR
jgi:hypothetical protein